MRYRWLALLAPLAAISAPPGPALAEPVLTTVFNTAEYGGTFSGRMAEDEEGVVYVAPIRGRQVPPNVFSLRKEADGQWTSKVIYTFPGVLGGIFAGLTYEPESRSLFGVFSGGGDRERSTIFRLTRPTDGSDTWTRTDLAAYRDRPINRDALTVSNGRLYGASKISGAGVKCGSIVEASPPAGGSGPWTVETIVQFNRVKDVCKPTGTMAVGSDGSLYGTFERTLASSNACGGVFRLIPPQNGGAWGTEVIHRFDRKGPCSPQGVTLGADGKLYGGTFAAGRDQLDQSGTLYQLTPPPALGGKWTYKRLFKGDGFGYNANVTLGPDGSLYGPAFKDLDRNGVPKTERVFRLTPPAGDAKTWEMTYLAVTNGTRGFEIPVIVAEDSSVVGAFRVPLKPKQAPCSVCSEVYEIVQ